jgi:hypothetical protein
MYITVGWSPLGATAPQTVETEILATIRKHKFVNTFAAHPQLILANIEQNFDPDQVQALHDELRQLAQTRYSYVITLSPNVWDLVASDDIETADNGQLRTIVTYRT